MTTLLDVTTIRTMVESDLSDTALGIVVAAADAEIVDKHGAHSGVVSEQFTPGVGDLYVFTRRPIASITSVTETYYGTYGETTNTLGTSDYVQEGVRRLRRKTAGNYPAVAWAHIVEVTYTPTDDSARRKGVLVDLVKLQLRYEGAELTQVGDVKVQHVGYENERAKILNRLASWTGGIA